MSSKQIKIEDYFNIMRDDNGRVFGIQEIGDTRDLIKAIEEQNEYIKTKEQECEYYKQKKEETTTFYLTKYANKDSECEELQHKVNVLSEALIRVNEIAQGVRNYLTCPAPRDVRYEMYLIFSKVKECNIESNKDDN